MSAILLGVTGLNALNVDTEFEPPHGQPAEAEQGMGRGEWDSVVGTDDLGNAKVTECAFEDIEGELGSGGAQSLAGQQLSGGVIGDGERIAVLPVTQFELALLVGTPKSIGLFGGV